MTGTSSADPGELRDYSGRATGALTDVQEAAGLLVTAMADLQAALPPGFGLSGDVDPTLPAVGRALALDAYVAEVAALFEEAGRGEVNGNTMTLDDGALPPVPTYDRAAIDALALRTADELATLRERLGDRSADETTLGELIGLLDMAHGLTDRGVADGRGTEVAESLIATMGPRDVGVMLDMLTAAAEDDPDRLDLVTDAVGDLSVVISRGLEDQPGRARRWVGTLTGDHDWYHDGPPEPLVLLGALTAPGTATLGTAVWGTVWDHTYSSESGRVLQHMAPEGGLLDQVFDTRDSLEVMAQSAAERPELANAIVMHTIGQGPEHFEHLLAQGGAHYPPFGEGTYDALGQMLTASVDPRLPVEDRLLAGSQTITMFDIVRSEGPHDHYADPILRGIGTMTQPLLANLDPENDLIVLPAAAGSGDVSADRLMSVVSALAGTDAGTQGLAVAVDGASTELVYRALDEGLADATSDPLSLPRLERLGRIVDEVVVAVANDRFNELVAAVEGGGVDLALQKAMLNGLGATPLEPIALITDTVLTYQGQSIDEGGGVLPDHPEVRLTYHLAMATLAAQPGLASPELVQGLQEAAAGDGLMREGGVLGVYSFLQSPDTDLQAFPGLVELRQHIDAQQAAIDIRAASVVEGVISDD